MTRIIKQRIFWTIVLIITLFTIFGYSSFDDVKPIELTDEIGFSQINTCKFSILELQSNNLKTLYQDHYKILPAINNWSHDPLRIKDGKNGLLAV